MAWGIACINYLNGFVGGYHHGTSKYTYPHVICFPSDGFTHVQIVAIFVAWGDKYPEQWHLKPWDSVFQAFSGAFPCRS